MGVKVVWLERFGKRMTDLHAIMFPEGQKWKGLITEGHEKQRMEYSSRVEL